MKLMHKTHAGRPCDFTGFDGRLYNGRIKAIKRRVWLSFTYYVPGTGWIDGLLDLRLHKDRIVVY